MANDMRSRCREALRNAAQILERKNDTIRSLHADLTLAEARIRCLELKLIRRHECQLEAQEI